MAPCIYAIARHDSESSYVWMLPSSLLPDSRWQIIAELRPRRQAPTTCVWRNQLHVREEEGGGPGLSSSDGLPLPLMVMNRWLVG
jgi:hypothetical protein